MNCTICKTGSFDDGHTTVTLERANTIVIVRDVPARVCDNCGEYYLAEPVAQRVYTQADEAAARHVQVEILQYVA